MKKEVYDEITGAAEKQRDAALALGMDMKDAMTLGWLNVLASQNYVVIGLLEEQSKLLKKWVLEQGE